MFARVTSFVAPPHFATYAVKQSRAKSVKVKSAGTRQVTGRHTSLSLLGQSSRANSSLVKQHVPWRKNVLCFCIKYDGKADIT